MRAKKSHSKIENQTGPLIQYFGKLYKEKVGEFYPPTWGRDMKIFKELLVFYDENTLKELLDLYFERPKRIYSIPFFKVDVSNLMQELLQRRETQPKQMEDNESWRFD